uniref:Uncharacterized protein n=1 Tax=Plectus sambesii TaxID=2011161 RepID=A0A914WC21_9BILA
MRPRDPRYRRACILCKPAHRNLDSRQHATCRPPPTVLDGAATRKQTTTRGSAASGARSDCIGAWAHRGAAKKFDPPDRVVFGDGSTTPMRNRRTHGSSRGSSCFSARRRSDRPPPTWPATARATQLLADTDELAAAQSVDDDFWIKTPTVIYRILRRPAPDDAKSGGRRRSNRRAPVRHLRSPPIRRNLRPIAHRPALPSYSSPLLLPSPPPPPPPQSLTQPHRTLSNWIRPERRVRSTKWIRRPSVVVFGGRLYLPKKQRRPQGHAEASKAQVSGDLRNPSITRQTIQCASSPSSTGDRPKPLHLLQEFAALIYSDNCRSAPSTWEPAGQRRLPKSGETTRNTARRGVQARWASRRACFQTPSDTSHREQVRHTDQSAYLSPSTTRPHPHSHLSHLPPPRSHQRIGKTMAPQGWEGGLQ